MKNVVNLSGSRVNSGDFLIEFGASQILSRSSQIKFLGNVSRHQNVKLQNSVAQFVFGGPLWSDSVFDNELKYVSTRAIPMGVGCDAHLNYEHAEPGNRTKLLIDNIKHLPLTTRDFSTLDFLRERGVSKAILGGCPAFLATYPYEVSVDSNKYFISDPSWWWNYRGAIKLINSLKKLQPNSEITFLWHRGIFNKFASPKLNILRTSINKYLNMIGVKTVDGEYSMDMFQNYCSGIHIGFRVHAHVFCRSNNIPSVLICEDHRSRAMVKVFDDLTQTLEDYNLNKVLKEIENQKSVQPIKLELNEITQEAINEILEY